MYSLLLLINKLDYIPIQVDQPGLKQRIRLQHRQGVLALHLDVVLGGRARGHVQLLHFVVGANEGGHQQRAEDQTDQLLPVELEFDVLQGERDSRSARSHDPGEGVVVEGKEFVEVLVPDVALQAGEEEVAKVDGEGRAAAELEVEEHDLLRVVFRVVPAVLNDYV